MNTIFVAEDNQPIASSLMRYLSQYEFQIIHRIDGKEAYEFILRQGNKIDLILLDIQLPNMDGVKICTNLRKQKVQIPIMMLTSTNDSMTVAKALNLGADDYLTKPFALPELLARCRALLRRPAFFESRQIKTAGIEIDLDLFTVYYKGEKIRLRKKEFELVHYLFKNRNQLITREQILANVWSNVPNPYVNTVDVHIAAIRKKLMVVDDQAKSLIQTVHGQGYRVNTLGIK
jgi:two-component system, OmpR family, alkaline phosphatase synthesis response regulator PhoP